MRVPRIHQPGCLEEGELQVLDSNAGRHLARALRLGPGDPLVLFDGRGREVEARIETLDKGRVQVRLGSPRINRVESPLVVTLGQGLARGERMDWVVQKATELGVIRLSPLQTERSEVRLSRERAAKRRDHWQRVAVSAAEQSGRPCVPDVDLPVSLAKWTDAVETDLRLVLDPQAETGLEALPAPASVALLVGPEGGLTAAEINQAREAGFRPLALGPRILRTETAPLAALSLLQYLWGDLAH